MILILTWISIIAGGILILLLILSLLGGLDLDLDIGGADADVDAGGLGVIKGALTFISVASWVIKLMMTGDQNVGLAVLIGVFCGLVALFLLRYLLTLLLRNEENVNWEYSDAMYERGQVYLKIPKDGSGMVTVAVNGSRRQLRAKSSENIEIPTGKSVLVVDVDGEVLVVKEENT